MANARAVRDPVAHTKSDGRNKSNPEVPKRILGMMILGRRLGDLKGSEMLPLAKRCRLLAELYETLGSLVEGRDLVYSNLDTSVALGKKLRTAIREAIREAHLTEKWLITRVNKRVDQHSRLAVLQSLVIARLFREATVGDFLRTGRAISPRHAHFAVDEIRLAFERTSLAESASTASATS